ncbi:SigE family RNA polymerase sigma factor [Saccharothrix syringae]|uniref:Uncharacterized protein n=1 Tax=Saccharothrix syringae TaxID=103733 RepID=A0A5Q0H132_SACSY|nr:hypothetical protein [Saccharothrix syringae]QFZ19908.1 hypothetical protein EKG83_22975 [Saccharothrix syringae]
MRLPDGFEEFAADASPRLSDTARLLTRDAGQAEDLLRTALAQVCRAWPRVRHAPEQHAHRVLVRAYAARWRRWRSEPPAEVPSERADAHGARMAVVRAKVWTARRRRVAAVVVCLLLVGATAAAVTWRQAGEPAVASFMIPEVQDADEYFGGNRVVAEGSAEAPEPVVVRYLPRFSPPALLTECLVDGDRRTDFRVAVAINGVPSFEGLCGGLPGAGEDWRGLVVGREAEVAVTALPGAPAGGGEPRPVPAGTEVRVRLGEPVPVDEYPLPPRPERLSPVREQVERQGGRVLLWSDPADPDRVQQVTAVLPEDGVYGYFTNAPGRVLVDFGGVTRVSGSWDYANLVSAGDLPVAGEVTITARPEGHRGDWALVLMTT